MIFVLRAIRNPHPTSSGAATPAWPQDRSRASGRKLTSVFGLLEELSAELEHHGQLAELERSDDGVELGARVSSVFAGGDQHGRPRSLISEWARRDPLAAVVISTNRILANRNDHGKRKRHCSCFFVGVLCDRIRGSFAIAGGYRTPVLSLERGGHFSSALPFPSAIPATTISRMDVLELCHIDPSRNRFRRYLLTEQRTLFGELDLVIHWGRMGSPLRMRSETFSDRARLEKRRDELVRLRLRHGYLSVAA